MARNGTTTETPAAVVIGLDSITGLQAARILARRGIPVVAIARDRAHPSCRTNACRRIVFGPTSGEELIDLLDSLASSFPRAPVLFPCTDLSVLALSRHRERLGRYRVVLPEPHVIELLADKARFHEHAVARGLPVAAGCVLRNAADARAAAARLVFPCVLKPAVKTDLWQARSKAKVLPVATPAELLTAYERCGGWVDAMVVQEWIEGPDQEHFTCNAYFDAASRPALTFVSQKLRQWPLDGGVGCLSQECRNDEVERETVRLFQGVGYRGLAYLEMKRDVRTGRHLIIEPNVGRPTGRSAAADAAGVPLLWAQYRDALGLEIPTASSGRSRKWIYLRQDCLSAFRHWRQGDLTLAEWGRSLRGCGQDAVFSWSDPRPFAADIARSVGKARSGRRREPRDAGGNVEHDIHGVVGIRLIDATAADAALVARQIGAPRGSLTREPDIVIRFVDELPVEGLRWIEYGRTGFTDTGFYVLRSGKRPSRARLAFEQAGGACEIVCQRGLRSVPLLIGLLTLAAVKRGYAPLHASAFRYRGTGVLVTGWAKGGKTEALLAFAAKGAEYIGDEWILLSPDGQSMHGVPEHIRLQDWHLEGLPAVARTVPLARRAFFRSVRGLDRLHGILPRGVARLAPLRLLGEALPALKRQLNVQLDPAAVFGGGPSGFTASFDKLFFMVSDEKSSVRVTPADPALVARRMAASVSYEQLPLRSAYLASRFAFPDHRAGWLEQAETLQAEITARALSGKEAYEVRHPYPVDLRELFDAMVPFCAPPADPAADAAPLAAMLPEGFPDAQATLR